MQRVPLHGGGGVATLSETPKELTKELPEAGEEDLTYIFRKALGVRRCAVCMRGGCCAY